MFGANAFGWPYFGQAYAGTIPAPAPAPTPTVVTYSPFRDLGNRNPEGDNGRRLYWTGKEFA